MPENCTKPLIITFRELLPERAVYGHDGRAINRHSSRTFIHFEPGDEGCTVRAALSVSKTLDGVPPFYEAVEYFWEAYGVPKLVPRVKVDGQQYWGDGLSWEKALSLLCEALSQEATAEAGEPMLCVVGEPLSPREATTLYNMAATA